jgi:hypothetical protein
MSGLYGERSWELNRRLRRLLQARSEFEDVAYYRELAAEYGLSTEAVEKRASRIRLKASAAFEPRARCAGCGQWPKKGATICSRCAGAEQDGRDNQMEEETDARVYE